MTEFWKKRLIGYCLALAMLVLSLSFGAPHAAAPWGSDPSGPEGTEPSSGYQEELKKTVIRIYTCDQTLYTALESIAEVYRQQTGRTVLVVLGQEQTCLESLQAALEGDQAPDIFCMHSMEDVRALKDRLLDLSGLGLLEQLCQKEFALSVDGKILGICADVQGEGLIYDASLLARAGFTRSDITSFADLETVSQFITGKRLGYGAFCAPGEEDGAWFGQLADPCGDLEGLRRFLDLYRANWVAGDGALPAFLAGKAVFYAGGTGDYTDVSALGDSNLDILPAYTQDNGSLKYMVRMCWGINGKADRRNLDAATVFMAWLMTAGEDGKVPADQLGLMTPFRQAAYYGNQLEKKLRTYMQTEPVQVVLPDVADNSQRLLQLGEAMRSYCNGPTEENWQAIVQLLEQG